jgi:hypothetical protein
MSDSWFIRATTKTGVTFVKDFCWNEAILVFKVFHDAAEKGFYPKSSYKIPHTWKTEIFESFMLPEGDIVLFELCERPVANDNPIIIYNAMWVERETEGRFQIKTQSPVEIEYTFTGLKPGRNPSEWLPIPVKVIDGNFGHYRPQVDEEMSADWHMGFYEEAVIAHEEMHANVLLANRFKDRVEPEHEGVFDLEPSEDDPDKNLPVLRLKEERDPLDMDADMFFLENDVFSLENDPEEKTGNRPAVDLAPKSLPTPDGKQETEGVLQSLNDHVKEAHEIMHKIVKGKILDIDMYSAPSIETEYQLFINGQTPISLRGVVIESIGFMEEISKMKDVFNVSKIKDSLNLPQYLFDLIDDFLRYRDFKIGVHPVDEKLVDGNDAAHSIFWDTEQKIVLYSSPLSESSNSLLFDFDDVNL